MGRELIWQLMTLQLDFNEMIRQGKLLIIQHAIFVDVSQFPDLAQHGVGQLGPYHLLLGVGASYFAVDGRERVEDLVVHGLVPGHHPLGVVDALAGALAVAVAEGAVQGALEGSSLHHLGWPLGLLLAHQHHQLRDVVGQHVLHRLQQLALQGLELAEILGLQLILKNGTARQEVSDTEE